MLKISKTSTGTALKLSGTPSKAGDFTFTLTVTDSAGLSTSKTYDMIPIQMKNLIHLVGHDIFDQKSIKELIR